MFMIDIFAWSPSLAATGHIRAASQGGAARTNISGARITAFDHEGLLL